jgi:hypothetical protein
MIKVDKKHLATLTKILCELPKRQCKFFPWLSYVSLEPGQKLTVINEQISYASVFRSLILRGFKDTNDNVVMYKNDMVTNTCPNESQHPLSKVLVTDYLRYHVKNSKGNPLFEYVFPPGNTDTRDFLVSIQNLGEAAGYLEAALGELARNMSTQSIREVFLDPIQAIEEAKSPPWKAFTRANNIIATVPTSYANPYNSNKRNRSIMSDKSNYSKTEGSGYQPNSQSQQTMMP